MDYGFLPGPVRTRASLTAYQEVELSEMNDAGKTFAEIAAYIEEKL
jgi:hypothetical protein